MHDARELLLDQAVSLSQRMLELGQAGEWNQVIELEAHRRGLLERAFATRDPVNELLALRVREILALDKSLMDLSLQVRDAVAGELGQFNRSRKVSNAYRASV